MFNRLRAGQSAAVAHLADHLHPIHGRLRPMNSYLFVAFNLDKRKSTDEYEEKAAVDIYAGLLERQPEFSHFGSDMPLEIECKHYAYTGVAPMLCFCCHWKQQYAR